MRIIVLSASARYLAESCRSAGHEFQAIDYFLDWDLQQLCRLDRPFNHQAVRLGVPEDLFSLAQFEGWDAVVVSGGFENDPELVRRLHGRVPILGYRSLQIARLGLMEYVDAVTEAVEPVGGSFPETRLQPPDREVTSQWLVKKLFGAGGRHVRTANSSGSFVSLRQGNVYQKQCDGELVSAVFVAANRGRNCEALGSSIQLVGEPEFGAPPFAYCGSVGPWDSSQQDEVANTIRQVGEAIALRFGFEGVFGVDFVIGKEPAGQRVWVIDINPRIPASAELLELVNPLVSVVGLQIDACVHQRLPGAPIAGGLHREPVVGKAILFCQNRNDLLVDQTRFDYLTALYRPPAARHSATQWIADIPCPGSRIGFGAPIVSLFVRGGSRADAHALLLDLAAQIGSRLY